ncbi:MAG: HIT domain-containing protein [Candidatus Andersenbacteria bacterium]
MNFTDPSVKELQELTRNEHIRVIYPLRPVIEAHFLLVPVRAVARLSDLSEPEVLALFQLLKQAQLVMAKAYGVDGFNFFANEGASASQRIPHVHFHLFGRSADEPINPFSILNDPAIAKARPTLSPDELSARVTMLRSAFPSS